MAQVEPYSVAFRVVIAERGGCPVHPILSVTIYRPKKHKTFLLPQYSDIDHRKVLGATTGRVLPEEVGSVHTNSVLGLRVLRCTRVIEYSF